MEIPQSTNRLLTRLFLRRFFENDLISSDSDRHETLALICGGLAALALFVAVFLCTKYLFGPPLPGPIAVLLLSDRFFFITVSMIVTALATLLVWDALSLEARDEAVLGVLPIPRRAMVRAKFQALMGFMSAFAIALNAAPSIVHPFLLLSKFREVALSGLVLLIVVHAVIVLMAAVFAFFAVLGARGLVQSVVPNSWFGPVSAVVQGILVIAGISTLLLLPAATANVSRDWLAPASPSPENVPTLWFLGAYETAAGGVVVNIPQPNVPPRLTLLDTRARETYRAHQPLFRRLSPIAPISVVAVALAAAAMYLWNSRRPRSVSAYASPAASLRGMFASAARALIVRKAVEQAGFFFTLQTLARSGPHRLSISAALACGLTGGILMLQRVGLLGVTPGAAPGVRLLAIQSLLVVPLLVAFRHTTRLPADLQARWMIEIGWTGDAESYLRGVMRAATLALNVIPACALLVLYVTQLGIALALVHFVLQVAFGILLLEALFVNVRTVPFACSYVSRGHLGVLGPRVVAIALLTFGFAALERFALAQPNRTLILVVVLVGAIAALRALARRMRRSGAEMLFDDIVEPPTQRLGLSGD